jgi:C-terminal processing protease CtpA/Prc
VEGETLGRLDLKKGANVRLVAEPDFHLEKPVVHGITFIPNQVPSLYRDVKKGSQQFLRVDGTKPLSPAEQAGLKPGDIVVKVGSMTVTDTADFERACLGRPVGEKVNLVIRRGESTETAPLTIAALSVLTGRQPPSSREQRRNRDGRKPGV